MRKPERVILAMLALLATASVPASFAKGPAPVRGPISPGHGSFCQSPGKPGTVWNFPGRGVGPGNKFCFGRPGEGHENGNKCRPPSPPCSFPGIGGLGACKPPVCKPQKDCNGGSNRNPFLSSTNNNNNNNALNNTVNNTNTNGNTVNSTNNNNITNINANGVGILPFAPTAQ